MNLNGNDNKRKLNILVISAQLPYPVDNGGAARLYNLYCRLKQNHHITWVCPVWPGKEEFTGEAGRYCHELVELPREDSRPFPDRGWRHLLFRAVARLGWERLFIYNYGYVQAPGLYWLPPSPQRAALIKRLLNASKFDLIVSEFEGNAELIPAGVEIPKIIVLHNIQSMMFKRIRQMYDSNWEDRLFFWPELLKIRRYEKQNYGRYDFATTVSELDQHHLQQLCANLPSGVIPNGVDVSEYRPAISNSAKPARTLVYFGTYTTAPNIDAILYFCREIFPLIRQKIGNVELRVIGRNPPAELSQYEGVKIVGFVPDVRMPVAQADVVVVPLRVGGGTRLKIVEALALGKAIVSTRVGAEGLDVTHDHDILLADEPKSFADSVIRLLEQPALRTKLGKNGRQLAEQKYDWDILAANLDKIFHRVANGLK